MDNFYRVIKAASDKFIVEGGAERIVCVSRKRNKKQAVVAGDRVTVEDGVITGVLPRTNLLKRPPIANVDACVIVVAFVPRPELLTIDKIIINCLKENIEPVLCLNKSDLFDTNFMQCITRQYPGREVVVTDALHCETDSLRAVIAGKTVCLAGQSAVGKSTLINALLGENTRQTGAMSDIERGKNTTTDIVLMPFAGGYIADTPGFSLIDLFDLTEGELDLYYPEFEPFLPRCKIHRCRHDCEPECAVREAAENGVFATERYTRYLRLLSELRTARKRLYK